MNKLIAASAAITLSYSISQAQQFHAQQFQGNNIGYAYPAAQPQVDHKDLFIQRLSLAPRHFCTCTEDITIKANNRPCKTTGKNISTIANLANSAVRIEKISNIVYGCSDVALSSQSKSDIEQSIHRSQGGCYPNQVMVVIGYDDKSDPLSSYRIAMSRAQEVKNHIAHFSHQNGLNIQSEMVTMGSEVYLKGANTTHNRVCEIWMMEFPKQANQQAQGSYNSQAPQGFTHPQVAPQYAPQTPQGFEPQHSPTPQYAPQQFAPQAPQQFQAPHQAPFMGAPEQQQQTPQVVDPQGLMIPRQPQFMANSAGQEIALQNPQTQIMNVPSPNNPFQVLTEFLEKNFVINNEADRAEFSQKLEALKQFSN